MEMPASNAMSSNWPEAGAKSTSSLSSSAFNRNARVELQGVDQPLHVSIDGRCPSLDQAIGEKHSLDPGS